jgi:hypothetical protein
MICKYPSCDASLRIDNKSGLCRNHSRYKNECKKCGNLCYKNRRYCYKCSHIFKTWRAKVFVLCQYDGCKTKTNGATKLCSQHFANYHKCESPGCKNRCRYTSKWRLCMEHRGMCKKLKAESIPEYSWEPVAITRRRVPSGSRTPGGRKAKLP